MSSSNSGQQGWNNQRQQFVSGAKWNVGGRAFGRGFAQRGGNWNRGRDSGDRGRYSYNYASANDNHRARGWGAVPLDSNDSGFDRTSTSVCNFLPLLSQGNVDGVCQQ